jgi:hypothetical protein
MWKIHVFTDDRPSKRCRPLTTASHVSWTTSSAIASVGTYMRATRFRLAWYVVTSVAKAASSPRLSAATSNPSPYGAFACASTAELVGDVGTACHGPARRAPVTRRSAATRQWLPTLTRRAGDPRTVGG